MRKFGSGLVRENLVSMKFLFQLLRWRCCFVCPGLGSILAALTCHHLTVNGAIEFLCVAKTAQISTTEDSSMPDTDS